MTPGIASAGWRANGGCAAMVPCIVVQSAEEACYFTDRLRVYRRVK